jgi:hypothetical protein
MAGTPLNGVDDLADFLQSFLGSHAAPRARFWAMRSRMAAMQKMQRPRIMMRVSRPHSRQAVKGSGRERSSRSLAIQCGILFSLTNVNVGWS